MSMSGPRSAVGRGGFTRSAGAAAGRGVLLIVFALAIGILLLARALDDDGSSVEAGDVQLDALRRRPGRDHAAHAGADHPDHRGAAAGPRPGPGARPRAERARGAGRGPGQQRGAAAARLQRAAARQHARRGRHHRTSTTPTPRTRPTPSTSRPRCRSRPDRVVPLGDTNLGVDVSAAKVVVVLGQDDLGLQPG